MRAVEARRWMARASNSGISAFIDPRGEIRDQVSFGQAGVLRRRIELGSRRTLYTRLGDWIVLLSAAVLAVHSINCVWRDWSYRSSRNERPSS